MNNDITILKQDNLQNSSHNQTEAVLLKAYIEKVNSFPILSEDDEKSLLEQFFIYHNKEAGHTVLNSHLRLVVKIAKDHKKYHASLLDLISEGNLGILKALKNFSLEKQVRFSTYAMFWIKASIREFLLRAMSSIARIGTTAAQKRIIFGLSKVKKFLGIIDNVSYEANIEKVANMLNVKEKELRSVQNAMYNMTNYSMNSPLSSEDNGAELGDTIASEDKTIETKFLENDNVNIVKGKIAEALASLSKREANIIKLRILNPEKYTLSDLSNKFNISKERVRQIQENALKKLRIALENDKEILSFIS
jgi:RNA polymerase sigma-32 factor